MCCVAKQGNPYSSYCSGPVAPGRKAFIMFIWLVVFGEVESMLS